MPVPNTKRYKLKTFKVLEVTLVTYYGNLSPFLARLAARLRRDRRVLFALQISAH